MEPCKSSIGMGYGVIIKNFFYHYFAFDSIEQQLNEDFVHTIFSLCCIFMSLCLNLIYESKNKSII